MLVFRMEVPPADRKGATDNNCSPIEVIDGWEVLGYYGGATAEHSGEPIDWRSIQFTGELIVPR